MELDEESPPCGPGEGFSGGDIPEYPASRVIDTDRFYRAIVAMENTVGGILQLLFAHIRIRGLVTRNR